MRERPPQAPVSRLDASHRSLESVFALAEPLRTLERKLDELGEGCLKHADHGHIEGGLLGDVSAVRVNGTVPQVLDAQEQSGTEVACPRSAVLVAMAAASSFSFWLSMPF